MAFRALHSLRHDDDDLYDMSKGMPEDWDLPEYPGGCCFTIKTSDLEACGAENGTPGDVMHFSAMACVTSVFKSETGCRIELEVMLFAGEDGKFCELSDPKPCICLTAPEIEKMDLDADCALGDLIHLMGTARLTSCSSSDWGEVCTMQITDLAFAEDESNEQPPEG